MLFYKMKFSPKHYLRSRLKCRDHPCMYIQIHVVVGTKRRSGISLATLSGKPALETPLPKFEQPGNLGTNFGIMQMSKILHAAKRCSRPISIAKSGDQYWHSVP